MSDLLRAILIKAALNVLGDIRTDNTTAVKSLFQPGDRKTVYDDGTDMGTITVSKPKGSWQVTHPSRFEKWVAEHHPEALKTVTTTIVDPEWQKALLKDDPTQGTGELPDGVDMVYGTPAYLVKPSEAALAAITRALPLEIGPSHTDPTPTK